MSSSSASTHASACSATPAAAPAASAPDPASAGLQEATPERCPRLPLAGLVAIPQNVNLRGSSSSPSNRSNASRSGSSIGGASGEAGLSAGAALPGDSAWGQRRRAWGQQLCGTG